VRLAFALVLLCAALPARAEVEVAAPAKMDTGDPWCWRSCWRPPNTFEVVVLGVSEGLILADVLMTLDFAQRPNEYPMGEVNPAAAALFGAHPSPWRVAGVGIAGMVLTAGLWYALPPFWRDEATLTIGAFELYNTVHMYSAGIRFRLP
jgi:hypothetical protein